MSGYSYAEEKKVLFSEEMQTTFLKVRDHVQQLLKTAGAFRMQEAMEVTSGNSWSTMACVDRLVELGEVVEIPRQSWAQYRIFTTPQTDNR